MFAPALFVALASASASAPKLDVDVHLYGESRGRSGDPGGRGGVGELELAPLGDARLRAGNWSAALTYQPRLLQRVMPDALAPMASHRGALRVERRLTERKRIFALQELQSGLLADPGNGANASLSPRLGVRSDDYRAGRTGVGTALAFGDRTRLDGELSYRYGAAGDPSQPLPVESGAAGHLEVRRKLSLRHGLRGRVEARESRFLAGRSATSGSASFGIETQLSRRTELHAGAGAGAVESQPDGVRTAFPSGYAGGSGRLFAGRNAFSFGVDGRLQPYVNAWSGRAYPRMEASGHAAWERTRHRLSLRLGAGRELSSGAEEVREGELIYRLRASSSSFFFAGGRVGMQRASPAAPAMDPYWMGFLAMAVTFEGVRE